MIYQLSKTFTANTTIDTIEKESIVMSKGIIYKIEIYFPPGSTGLTNVRLTEKGRQIYPYPPGEFFRGENVIISFDDTYIVKDIPYTFDFEGFYEDDTYNHIVVVRLGHVGNDDLIRRYIPSSIDEIIERMREEEKRKESLDITQAMKELSDDLRKR